MVLNASPADVNYGSLKGIVILLWILLGFQLQPQALRKQLAEDAVQNHGSDLKHPQWPKACDDGNQPCPTAQPAKDMFLNHN